MSFCQGFLGSPTHIILSGPAGNNEMTSASFACVLQKGL